MNASVPCIKGLPCPFTNISHATCAEWCSSIAHCSAFVSNKYNHCYLRASRGDLVASDAVHGTQICWRLSAQHNSTLHPAYVITLAVRAYREHEGADDDMVSCPPPVQSTRLPSDHVCV